MRMIARQTAIFLALFVIGQAAANDPMLGGRPFVEPGEVVPMPATWVASPIRRDTPKPVDLALSLDQEMYPGLVPLIQEFARERGVEIAVQEGTCGTSGGALADKTADMAGFCCPPAATDRLPGLVYHTVGIGAIALIVHPESDIDNLTLDEARMLFSGHARSWADLPMSGISAGQGQEVRAISRLHCKERPGHWRLILDDEDLFGRDIQEVSNIEDMIIQVGRTPGSIGYETLWHITRHEDRQKVKIVKLNGIDPMDSAALAKGEYPIYRVFNITSWSDTPAANQLADQLVAFILENAPRIAPVFRTVPAAELKRQGWKFHGNELIGEPE